MLTTPSKHPNSERWAMVLFQTCTSLTRSPWVGAGRASAPPRRLPTHRADIYIYIYIYIYTHTTYTHISLSIYIYTYTCM